MSDAAADPQDTLHSKLTDQLLGVFDSAAEKQRAYYEANPEERPALANVETIITSYSYKNAAIAGGLSLIPGPWGLVAIVPEIVLVIRNQVSMVYDIGVAYGKESMMSKELLLGITLSATGAGTLGLLTMHGGKVLVKRKALRVFQKLVALLAGKITQRVIKSAIAKWLPLIGALAIAVWTKTSTAAIGAKAKEILSKEIDFAEDDDSRLLEDHGPALQRQRVEVTVQKVHALGNLMKADGCITETELEYLDALLDNSDLPGDVCEQLRATFEDPAQHPVDLEFFENDDDERLALIMDLVALANRDGDFHVAEKVYVRQVAKRVGFPEGELELLTA